MARSIKVAATCAVALLVVSTAPFEGGPAPVAAQSRCDALEQQFNSTVRPRILRVIYRDRSLANWYNATLKRIKRGKNPTRGEIRKAYSMLRKSCSTRRNPAKCRSFAKSMLGAAQKLFAYNRRWANAGCRGTLRG